MEDVISQAFLTEVKHQIEARIDSGHERVRQSLNELTEEVRSLHDQVIVITTQRASERLPCLERHAVSAQVAARVDEMRIVRARLDGKMVTLIGGISALVNGMMWLIHMLFVK